MRIRFRLDKSRPLFIFVCLIWFYATFFIFLPYWCLRYPKFCNPHFSDWCDISEPDDRSIDQENIDRSLTALRLLEKLPKIDFDQNRLIDKSKLTVGIIAKRRPSQKSSDQKSIPHQYLTQVASKLLDMKNRLAESKSKSINLFICNVDEEPDQFREAIDLSRYVPMIKKNQTTKWILGQKSISDQIFDQEKSDYVFCLRQATKLTMARGHVILFEDDALPVDHFGSMLQSIIDQLFQRRLRYSDQSIFIKFYHPERYRKLPWLILVCCYSLVLTISILIISNRLSIFNPNRRLQILFYLLTYVYLTLFLWCLGHQTIASIRYFLTQSIYLIHHESCCTPSVLFDYRSASIVADYLDTKTAKNGYALDHILDEMPSITKLMTDLNLVRHIGKYSNLRERPVHVDPW